MLALAVIQVALLLHARATLTAAAAEGARAGALAGADLRTGVVRATALVSQNVSSALVRDISAALDEVDGLEVITVRIDAEVPGIGLLGSTQVDVVGHAIIEGTP